MSETTHGGANAPEGEQTANVQGNVEDGAAVNAVRHETFMPVQEVARRNTTEVVPTGAALTVDVLETRPQTAEALAREAAMEKILALRQKNGLSATKEAVMQVLQSTDFTYSWSKKRGHRKVGGSPIGINKDYLEAHSACPVTGEVFRLAGDATTQTAALSGAESLLALASYLRSKSFNVNSVTDDFTQERQLTLPPEIEALNPKFGADAQRDATSLALEVHPDGKRIFVELAVLLKHLGIEPQPRNAREALPIVNPLGGGQEIGAAIEA